MLLGGIVVILPAAILVLVGRWVFDSFILLFQPLIDMVIERSISWAMASRIGLVTALEGPSTGVVGLPALRLAVAGAVSARQVRAAIVRADMRLLFHR